MTALTRVRRALVVVAHPDDESFGLGALLSSLTARGAAVAVLCFTRGEASTLHDRPGELATLRSAELAAAAEVLEVESTELLDYPDGGLAEVPLADLTDRVRTAIARFRPTHLLVFDTGGITGHPDHQRATEAALSAADRLPVLAWVLPEQVATALNDEFHTRFAGRPDGELGPPLPVSRSRQWKAIACHRSQSSDNPVLHRRLDLLGDREYVRPLTSGT
ncbi:PIG-L family deacetylase [Amycolatopsis sp. K13G38]|uniref:PIG-L family deacetylase n=1 Tax=Amycolatopsis acididurans TaxID=2724524 RepID=A0ABX1JHR9_9PSEU|nr:PIG-L deacetylase family protein [Amycolatopsis acididurans]NKQ59353.1 PIG-L family deacetylase [Amycolatopsis acididurans]